MSKFYDAMLGNVANMLGNVKFELLSIAETEKEDENGKKEQFYRLELEVPRGFGSFSRTRFSCKVQKIKNINITEEELENGVFINLKGFQITFISSAKEVYTKAESFEIID